MKKKLRYILWAIGILTGITLLSFLTLYIIFLNVEKIDKNQLIKRIERAFELRETSYKDSSTNIHVGVKKSSINVLVDYRYDKNFSFHFLNEHGIPFDTLEKQKIKFVLQKYLPDTCIDFKLSTSGTGALIIDCFNSTGELHNCARNFIREYFSDRDVKYSKVNFAIYRDTLENIKEFEVK